MTNYTAYTKVANEGGYGYNPHEESMQAAAREAAETRIAGLVARADELRAAWNAAVAKHAANGQVSMAALKLIESEVGITLGDLKTIKARLTK
jgi:hypothetical protein